MSDILNNNLSTKDSNLELYDIKMVGHYSDMYDIPLLDNGINNQIVLKEDDKMISYIAYAQYVNSYSCSNYYYYSPSYYSNSGSYYDSGCSQCYDGNYSGYTETCYICARTGQYWQNFYPVSGYNNDGYIAHRQRCIDTYYCYNVYNPSYYEYYNYSSCTNYTNYINIEDGSLVPFISEAPNILRDTLVSFKIPDKWNIIDNKLVMLIYDKCGNIVFKDDFKYDSGIRKAYNSIPSSLKDKAEKIEVVFNDMNVYSSYINNEIFETGIYRITV